MVHSTIEFLAYGNYNCYRNWSSGLSGTMEMQGWSNQGYQLISTCVYARDNYKPHGCPYVAMVPYWGAMVMWFFFLMHDRYESISHHTVTNNWPQCVSIDSQLIFASFSPLMVTVMY